MRARFRVNGASVCLQPLRGGLVTVWGRWAGRDGGERTQQETLAERAGASWRGRSVVRTLGQLQPGRQAGSGIARSRARARLNWVSQGQRRGRCRVNRRAERVSRRPGRRPVAGGSWWSRSADPGRCGLSSGPGCAPSPVPPARRRWRRSGPRGDG